MPAVAGGVFGIAAFQVQSGLLIALFSEVVQETWIGAFGQLSCQRVNASEHLREVRLWRRRAQGFDGIVQVNQRLKQVFLDRIHEAY